MQKHNNEYAYWQKGFSIPSSAAERKAQAQVGDDDMVAFLHLHGSRPVGGEHGTEVEWRYSYQVIPPGGPAADTAPEGLRRGVHSPAAPMVSGPAASRDSNLIEPHRYRLNVLTTQL